jgi:FkbH-like protein
MTEAIESQAKIRGASSDRLRQEISALLELGRRDSAIQAARFLLKEQPGVRTWRFLRNAAESDGAERAGLKPYKIALLSSFAIEFVHDALIAFGFINGFKIQIYQGGFGTFRQELLDASRLYACAPDAVIIAVEGADWVPWVYSAASHRENEDPTVLIENFRSELSALLSRARSRLNVPLLVHNFPLPAWRRLGILDAGSQDGQARLVSRLNDALLEIAEKADGVHIVDYAGLVNRYGTRHSYDHRMRLYAGAPITQPMLGELAREYMKFVRCLVGFNKKCLVLDLDNTLWGGVVGEEGVDGIQLGPSYPGSAFLEFQQHILALQQRGVILAIASKNNPADIDEVFARHRFMQLRKDHFADVQVGWGAKSESLRRLANNLGIGLEHVVLVDDNPAECEEIRRALPMVTLIQLPPQPELYVEALHEDGWFDTVALSSEDLRRGELYQQRASAEALRSSAAGLEDYYRALDMELRIAPVDRTSLKRAAQLTQKTNQLNVTTRRYSEAELSALMADRHWLLVTIGLIDRFGDNGIVGLMLAKVAGDALNIDTFLLSCRVIGRAVETAMLAHLCDLAEQHGLDAVIGELIPTAKNLPVRDLFERHGFAKATEDPSGTTMWRLCLPQQRVPWPDWFRVVREGAEQREIAAGRA